MRIRQAPLPIGAIGLSACDRRGWDSVSSARSSKGTQPGVSFFYM